MFGNDQNRGHKESELRGLRGLHVGDAQSRFVLKL